MIVINSILGFKNVALDLNVNLPAEHIDHLMIWK